MSAKLRVSRYARWPANAGLSAPRMISGGHKLDKGKEVAETQEVKLRLSNPALFKAKERPPECISIFLKCHGKKNTLEFSPRLSPSS